MIPAPPSIHDCKEYMTKQEKSFKNNKMDALHSNPKYQTLDVIRIARISNPNPVTPHHYSYGTVIELHEAYIVVVFPEYDTFLQIYTSYLNKTFKNILKFRNDDTKIELIRRFKDGQTVKKNIMHSINGVSFIDVTILSLDDTNMMINYTFKGDELQNSFSSSIPPLELFLDQIKYKYFTYIYNKYFDKP